MIDSKLAQRYRFPILDLMQVPNLVKEIALDLSVFFMYERLYSSNAPNLDEYQQHRYSRAMELIDSILSGEIDLPGVEEDPKWMRAAKYGSTTEGTDNIFSYDEPEW